MNKTVMTAVFGAAAVALLGVCLYQQQTLRRQQAELQLVSKTLEARERQAAEEAQHKQKEKALAVKKRSEADAPARARSDGPKAVLAGTKPEAAPAEMKAETAPVGDAPMSDIAKMMKNPGMKDMIRAQQKGQQDMMYGSLFKCLQLSEADMDTFKSLLLDRQMALVDSSMDMMSGSATPEEKKAAAEMLKETTAAYEAKIKELLGDDNFTVYKAFEETQAERMQVTMFKGSLSAADQLSDEQEDGLIRSMHEARSGFKFSVPGADGNQVADPAQFTQEGIAKMLEESAKLQELYVAKAAEVLTPSQLEQFKANQKQQQAMQEMGMKMAAKMFGQGKAAAPAKQE